MCKLASFLFCFLSAIATAQSNTELVVQRYVPMKTRDGVTLFADVYRPAGEGKFPTLLQRTPYDKRNGEEQGRRAAADGYLVVIQDVRGRFSSEGEWYPFKHETEDGYDAVEWAAMLPNSNGKVGMFGGSYVGATQMLAAIGHPPHLAGLCPYVTASNYHENWVYQGGAFEQWFSESWTSALAQDSFNRMVQKASNPLTGAQFLPLRTYPVFNNQTFGDGAQLTKTLAPYFLDWLAHPDYDDYWKRWSIEEHFSDIRVPVLNIGAWYDLFQQGSIRNYEGLKLHGGNATTREGARLLIVPGGHAGTGRQIGALDFGSAAAEFDDMTTTLDWYDFLFKGKQNEFAAHPVKLFVMGENKWRYEDEWPLARTKMTPYFLYSSGDANSSKGTGVLSDKREKSTAASDAFTFDPSNPVPTVGGPLCCSLLIPAGPRDQAKVEERSDVLVYTTPPLQSEVEVTGPIKLHLFASSSANDTDFTGKLVDVWPNGFAQNLTEGILRARYRESSQSADPIQPNTIYEYEIDLWSTSNVFLKGHAIRLEISSSNFPRFDRNLNTGKSGANESLSVKANNKIYHDGAHPSALMLPIIPKE